MENNKHIRNTWIMVAAITGAAFMISGLIQLKNDKEVWLTVMRLFSALLLYSSAIIIRIKSSRIFSAPAAYAILFFIGYVLSLVGLMTELKFSLWALGSLSLLALIILPFRLKNNSGN